MLRIPREVLKEIFSHVTSSYPDEACGLLIGRRIGLRGYVECAVATKNSYDGPKRARYSIDPLEYLRIEERAISEGREVIGVFHSHPDGPASPSMYDVENAVPGFSYVILSVKLGELKDIKCWRVDEESGSMIEENLEIE